MDKEQRLIAYLRQIKSAKVTISFENGVPVNIKVHTPVEWFEVPDVLTSTTDLESYLLGYMKQHGYGQLIVEVRDGLVVSEALEGSYISYRI